MIGVSGGLVATLVSASFPGSTLIQALGLMGIAGVAGSMYAKTVSPTELPQTVALFHSLVGLAAVTTSVG